MPFFFSLLSLPRLCCSLKRLLAGCSGEAVCAFPCVRRARWPCACLSPPPPPPAPSPRPASASCAPHHSPPLLRDRPFPPLCPALGAGPCACVCSHSILPLFSPSCPPPPLSPPLRPQFDGGVLLQEQRDAFDALFDWLRSRADPGHFVSRRQARAGRIADGQISTTAAHSARFPAARAACLPAFPARCCLRWCERAVRSPLLIVVVVRRGLLSRRGGRRSSPRVVPWCSSRVRACCYPTNLPTPYPLPIHPPNAACTHH